MKLVYLLDNAIRDNLRNELWLSALPQLSVNGAAPSVESSVSGVRRPVLARSALIHVVVEGKERSKICNPLEMPLRDGKPVYLMC